MELMKILLDERRRREILLFFLFHSYFLALLKLRILGSTNKIVFQFTKVL